MFFRLWTMEMYLEDALFNWSLLIHRYIHLLSLSLHFIVLQGAGFPFFTWAQLFFTAADHVSLFIFSSSNLSIQEFIGWFKGNGDFNKPAMYTLPDVSKMMKPLPYVVLSKVGRSFSFSLINILKVHDCLEKVHKFLTKNDDQFKCALVWKGKNHLEIFAKVRSQLQIEYLNK